MSDTAGATSADGGEAAGEATNITADGTGGTASMLSDGSGDTGSEGGSGGEDGKVDLKSLLGEELSSNKGFEKYMNSENPVQDMAKSLLEAQSQIGKPKVGIPGEQSTDEETSAFYKELGVPDNAKDYGFEKPESFPEGMEYDESHAEKWAERFKELNVPSEVANNLRNEFFQEMIDGQSVEEEAANKALNESLKQHLGENAAVTAKEIGALMKEAIPDQALREQIEAAVGNENTPAFGAALGLAIQHMKKTYGMADTNIGDGGSGSGRTVTDIRAEAQKLMSSEAYRDQMHRDHSSVKKQINEMYKQVGSLTDAAAKR